MKRLLAFSAAAFLCLAGTACSHAQKITHADSFAPKEGAFLVHFDWIKDKSTKYDMQLRLVNSTAQPALVYLDDIRCYRGKTEGMLAQPAFGGGARYFKLHEGQSQEFTLVCNLKEEASGDFRIVVTKAYVSASSDGKVSDKLVAENVSDALSPAQP